MEKLSGNIEAIEGTQIDGSSGERALCEKVPFVLNDGVTCLFPVIVLDGLPPLIPTPLIRHEMVHVRKCLGYREADIRDSYWNADLQAYCLDRFYEILQWRTRTFLSEERLACRENYPPNMLDYVFDTVYIPMAIQKMATIVDWYLNDMGQRVDGKRLVNLVKRTMTETLANGGYGASSGRKPAVVGSATAGIIRRALDLWEDQAQPFDELVARTTAKEPRPARQP